jgi:hypothetical protein
MSISPRLVTCLALTLAMSGTALPAQSELVLTKAGSKEYHRPGCDVVKDGKNVLALTRGKAAARGLTPHPACDPAQAGTPPEPTASTPAAPEYVYTDGSRYYHKKDCAKLGKDPQASAGGKPAKPAASAPKKTDLEEAGKKLWPCPTCKPPIRKRQR